MLKKIDSGSERYINNKFEMKIKQSSSKFNGDVSPYVRRVIVSNLIWKNYLEI